MLLQSDAVEQLLETNPDGLYTALNGVLRTLIADTSAATLDAGWALYWGLAVTLVVWTGLKRAFGGSGWDMWEYWRLVVALIVPLTILGAYDQPLRLTATIPITLPGSTAALTFPELITAQGTWLAQEINDEGQDRFWTYVRSLGHRFVDTLTMAEADAPTFSVLHVGAWLGSLTFSAISLGLATLAFLIAALAAIVGFAQVMFAQIAIAVCVVLGPVLIPWILLGPMAFLFWGWFRSLLTYGLYAAVSAAIFRVILALLEGTTNRVLDAVDMGRLASLAPDERQAEFDMAMFWIVTLVVCSLAGIVSFLKIPAMAAGLVSGQAGGESIGAALATVGAAAAGAGKTALAGARK